MPKVTQLGTVLPLIGIGNFIDATGQGPGSVITSIGSNGQVAWASNVLGITADGSNTLLRPYINFASGSNIVFTFDGLVGSTPSNTLRIHSTSTGGPGGSFSLTANGSNSLASPVDLISGTDIL